MAFLISKLLSDSIQVRATTQWHLSKSYSTPILPPVQGRRMHQLTTANFVMSRWHYWRWGHKCYLPRSIIHCSFCTNNNLQTILSKTKHAFSKLTWVQALYLPFLIFVASLVQQLHWCHLASIAHAEKWWNSIFSLGVRNLWLRVERTHSCHLQILKQTNLKNEPAWHRISPCIWPWLWKHRDQ
jgi:hypothetical protein